MKNLFLISLIVLISSLNSFSQILEECEVILTEKTEDRSRPYLGNNKFLLEVLAEHQIFLPKDYIEKLDEKGRYNGMDLQLEDLRNPTESGYQPSNENGRVLFNGPIIYYLPVVIYNHANSSGQTAFTNQEIYDYFGENFRRFRENSGSIEFFIKQIFVIPNSPHYNHTGSNYSLFTSHFEGNAMNVHLVNDAPSAGSAYKPGRRLYISKLKSPDALWNTLAHEFGHNFNLHHTHHGSCLSNKNNEDCGNCEQEPVSRTMMEGIPCGNFNNSRKCEVNGDGFCDTPGEPEMNQYANFTVIDTSSCLIQTIPPNFIDNWGATWQPDVKNIMSYSWRRCRTKFSYSQVAAMYYEIQSNSLFSFKSTQASGNISGPTLLCPNQTYTFTAPNQQGAPYFLWQVPPGWNIVGQGNQNVQITVPSWSPGDHYIYVNSFSGIFPGSSVAPLKVTFNNSQLTITGPSEIANDGVCRTFHTTHIPGLTYNWTTSATSGSGVTICSGQGTSSISVKATGSAPSFYLNVSTAGVCGIPANGSRFITVNTGGGGGPIARMSEENIIFYPNPSSEFLYFKDKNRADFKIENVSFINIITGIPDLIIDCVEAAELIDISKIRPGVYLIQYNVEGKLNTYKIMKK